MYQPGADGDKGGLGLHREGKGRGGEGEGRGRGGTIRMGGTAKGCARSWA